MNVYDYYASTTIGAVSMRLMISPGGWYGFILGCVCLMVGYKLMSEIKIGESS